MAKKNSDEDVQAPETPVIAAEVIMREVEEDMKEAFLNYAMSTIVTRAIPDVRDGFKPVHRRILYAMYDMGIVHNKPFKKSARIVGEVLGKYHPHGDSAVYESMVRMVQTFALRYPLIDGQGNFGSVDGDSAAAMRYTEARMLSEGEEILEDLEKDTVEFRDNFDASLKEPVVLPSKFPNMLVNGSTGIAVGMATNMPPHNLTEVCRTIIATIKKPDIEVAEVMEYIRGPDFPTGGIILGNVGILQAYSTGRGKIQVRARALVEEKNNHRAIIITEIPYQVNKSTLLQEIAELVKDKRIIGIDDLRDESDRMGMRIVIELKRDAIPDVILNQLYSFSKLQVTFGIINLAIVENQPKVLSLKALIKYYIKHRKHVIVKRTTYDLNKAKDRAHILAGLIIALNDIDAAIELIKKSKSAAEARVSLISHYGLSEAQANAILEMKLQRLTGLEQDKIRAEEQELLALIKEYESILASEQKVLDIIIAELEDMITKYGDGRRTMIDTSFIDEGFDAEKLIKPEQVVVTISNSGYIKRLPLDTYKQQKRGGRGVIAAETAETDSIKHVFVANTHDYLLFFTDKGMVHWKKVYELPEASRQARGNAIVNLLSLEQNEKISAYIPISEFDDKHYLVMFTKDGTVKKTNLSEYSRPRKGGIIGINLTEGDELINVLLTNGDQQLFLATAKGMAVKCHESDMRSVGRNSIGVRGIRLREGDSVVSAVIAPDHLTVLTITQKGFGKRSLISDYRLINRGGVGVINIIANERNGDVVSVIVGNDDDDVLLISREGIIIRIPFSGVSVIGRNTQGVRLMKLADTDGVVNATKVMSSKQEDATIAEQEAELQDRKPTTPSALNSSLDSSETISEKDIPHDFVDSSELDDESENNGVAPESDLDNSDSDKN